MKMHLRVSYLDGSAVDVTTTAADLIKFEERYDRSIARLEVEFRLTDLCFLAWHALQRTGRTAMSFDEWVNTIEAVSPGEGEAEIVPLESPQPTG